MTDQEKVQLVAELLLSDREAQGCPYRVSWERRLKKALRSLLNELLGREPTDQEIQDAESL